MHSVLVFTPVYRLETETIESIFSLEWNGPLSFLLQRDNPIPGDDRRTGVMNHYHQYQRGRDTFLRGDYDAMLVIESDIIVAPDALKRLAAIDADVAYGVYVLRAGNGMVVNIFERYPQPARNQGESLSLRGMWPEAKQEGVMECSGGGLGCVLIKRHVVEAVPFREEDEQVFVDTYFTRDVYQAGYEMKADTAVICGHKDVDGKVLWPL